jgi:hypothetical protein
MANRAARTRAAPRTIPEWLVSPWFYVLAAVGVGVLVTQIVTGTLAPRWIKALMGGIFFLSLLRLPLYGVACLFLIAFPFPTFIFLGNTNVIFVLFMLVVWGIRVRLGKEERPPRTYLDIAAGVYVAAQVLSFANVDTQVDLMQGLYQVQFLAAAAAFYYFLSKVLHSERQLKAILYALTVTSTLVSISGVMEYFIPTFRLIPDWFIAAGPSARRLEEGGRVGGIFKFHGLLADFSAMVFILQLFLFLRTRRVLPRVFLALLMFSDVFLIFVTANRGGLVVWLIGLAYFVWLGRSGLTLRRIVFALPVLLAIGVGVDLVATHYGRNVSLFWRLMSTQLERGVPDTRVAVWREVIAEIPEHLWIGHGPYYNLLGGRGALGRQWPHSAYLMYLWTTGILGLAVFLWILGKAMVRSFPGRRLHLARVPFAQGVLAVTHVQIVQFALAQIRDEHQRGNVYVFLMWTYFALAVASERIWKQGQAEAALPARESRPSGGQAP